ncbi:hypothetical protein PBRA_009730 [Plasmodiophora brassicae]|uniref:Uncharacterized protein n=1 Tax=Plasmodiophora brassicae TaxID=37360 RepID=A0A0G4IN96_PLABS|nr:hypothetical protein PBRA_009730 [Plasmodiophora brassicae]
MSRPRVPHCLLSCSCQDVMRWRPVSAELPLFINEFRALSMVRTTTSLGRFGTSVRNRRMKMDAGQRKADADPAVGAISARSSTRRRCKSRKPSSASSCMAARHAVVFGITRRRSSLTSRLPAPGPTSPPTSDILPTDPLPPQHVLLDA